MAEPKDDGVPKSTPKGINRSIASWRIFARSAYRMYGLNLKKYTTYLYIELLLCRPEVFCETINIKIV